MKINSNNQNLNNQKPQKQPQFKGFYEATSMVQGNTLLNRGILELGGCAVPQVYMSNTKDEAIERGMEGVAYFFAACVTPFFMLPALNKMFLKSGGIVSSLKTLEKNIVHMSKEYLTKDNDYLVKGIKETGLRLDAEKIVATAKKEGKSLNLVEEIQKLKSSGEKLENQKAMDDLLKRFEGREGDLKEKLVTFHKRVFQGDYLTTAGMWCAIPYVVTGLTEKRTHKMGYSGSFDMVDQSKYDEKAYKKAKKKKLMWSTALATVPAIMLPKVAMDATTKVDSLKKYAKNFDYSKGMFMSKLIYATMWLGSSYPSRLIGSRDNAELKDRAIRGAVLIAMFFGGDFAINNVLGRTLDKFGGTKIMKDLPDSGKTQGKFMKFINNFKKVPVEINEIHKINAPLDVIKKSKKYSAILYWFALMANASIIGFAMPAVLNAMLKKSVAKENVQSSEGNVNFQGDMKQIHNKEVFKNFALSSK